MTLITGSVQKSSLTINSICYIKEMFFFCSFKHCSPFRLLFSCRRGLLHLLLHCKRDSSLFFILFPLFSVVHLLFIQTICLRLNTLFFLGRAPISLSLCVFSKQEPRWRVLTSKACVMMRRRKRHALMNSGHVVIAGPVQNGFYEISFAP